LLQFFSVLITPTARLPRGAQWLSLGPAFSYYLCMDIRRKVKIAAIKLRLESCEAEKRRLLAALTSAQVNLAKIHEHMEQVESDLRLLTRDLEMQESAEIEGEN
jgi:hypothetical protein